MTDLVQAAVFVLACAAALAIVVSSLRVGIAPMPSSLRAGSAMLEAVGALRDCTVVDLGSGWGTLAIRFAREHPQCHVIGYEISPVPWAVSWVLKHVSRLPNLDFVRRDFLQADLPERAVLLCYLFPAGMQALASKLEADNCVPALIVSNTFALPGREPEAVIRLDDLYRTPIYVYRGHTAS